MTHQEAVALIEHAEIRPGESWADLGAGQGRFSFAMADLLGENGVVYAVDRDGKALQNISAQHQKSWAEIRLIEQDFTQALQFKGLDGVLMANALHYVRDQAAFLARLKPQTGKQRRIILIEYDTDQGNPWVPYPVSFSKFGMLAKQAGLTAPQKIGSQQSRYGYREMYAAVSEWNNETI
ncbi:MAG: class I SAM-dependent methyltransferase [Bacteroidota bacterium]